MKIVAVTSCPTGIAHTYMAAEALEGEKEALFTLLSSPAFYTSQADKVVQTKQRLASVEEELHAAYARWLELESLVSSDADRKRTETRPPPQPGG